MSLEAWKSFFEIGGVALLALTFVFGAGGWIVNNRLNKEQARELSEFRLKFEGEQQKTALAQKQAFEAKQKADAFEKDIATANQKAAEAEKTAARFHLEIAQANQRAAEANQIAESETLARVELEKQLEPRRLTTKQKEELTSLLSGNPQSIMIGVCWGTGSDCEDFANDIGDALKKAGWKTFFGASLNSKRGVEVGFAQGSDPKLVSHWVPKVRNALAQIGVSSTESWLDPNDKTQVGGVEKNVLYLIVHAKPEITTGKSEKSPVQGRN